MKFLDLNGLKHLLEKLVSYNSRNGIAVKRIEGKPEPGKSNSTLVLGSGIKDFTFYNYADKDSWMQAISDNGKSSILIGKKDINASSLDVDNKGISLISNDNISLYAYSDFNLKTRSGARIISSESIAFTTTNRNIQMSAYDYIQFTGNTQNPNISAKIIVDDGIRMNTSRIHIRDNSNNDDDVSFFKTGTNREISIGGTVNTGPVIKIEGGKTPFNIKFRLGSDVTARLTNINSEKGFYIFTNLYAKTDNSTDLPTNITPTAKEALDTKSVQCLLAELLMKTGLY